MQSIKHPFFLRFHEEVTCFIDRAQVMRWSDVSLTIGRVLQQLTVFAVVAFRIAHRTKGLNDEQPVVGPGELDPVDGPPWNDQIITIAKGQFAVHRVQNAGSFMYEDDFVGVGIFEEITLHAFLGGGEDDVAVVVHQHGDA